MMNKPTYRKIQSVLSLITFVVLFASFHFQYITGLQPCPLCLMQRLCVFLLLCITGLSIGTEKKANIISVLQFFVACAGLFFSLRQVWLQSLPPGQTPACMPGLDVLIHYFPWQTVFHSLFWGSGDCAEAAWVLFGISMAGWSALYFLFMAITTFLLFRYTRQRAIIK